MQVIEDEVSHFYEDFGQSDYHWRRVKLDDHEEVKMIADEASDFYKNLCQQDFHGHKEMLDDLGEVNHFYEDSLWHKETPDDHDEVVVTYCNFVLVEVSSLDAVESGFYVDCDYCHSDPHKLHDRDCKMGSELFFHGFYYHSLGYAYGGDSDFDVDHCPSLKNLSANGIPEQNGQTRHIHST